MKIKIKTKELFTDNGQFIKKMNCPIKAAWDDMERTTNAFERQCKGCNKMVTDTEYLSDDEILYIIKKNANTCFRVINTKYI